MHNECFRQRFEETDWCDIKFLTRPIALENALPASMDTKLDFCRILVIYLTMQCLHVNGAVFQIDATLMYVKGLLLR